MTWCVDGFRSLSSRDAFSFYFILFILHVQLGVRVHVQLGVIFFDEEILYAFRRLSVIIRRCFALRSPAKFTISLLLLILLYFSLSFACIIHKLDIGSKWVLFCRIDTSPRWSPGPSRSSNESTTTLFRFVGEMTTSMYSNGLARNLRFLSNAVMNVTIDSNTSDNCRLP